MEKEFKPLVSIIVITYNSARYVLETLESAKEQTYQNIELIVSDDSSTDNTVEICREWIDNNKGRFVRTELIAHPVNTGIPSNCNRGVKAVQGEWVKLIAGDDALMPDCVDTYVAHIKINSEKTVLFSNVLHYHGKFAKEFKAPLFNTSELKISQPDVTAKEQFEILLRTNKIWAGSLFLNRGVFDKVGFFDETLRLWEDRPFLLKLTRNGIKLHFIDFISAKYRKSASSIQQKKNNTKLFSEFTLETSIYYYKNYLKFLPIVERILKKILLFRIIKLNQYGFNKNNFMLKLLLKFTAYPWTMFLKNIRRKYK